MDAKRKASATPEQQQHKPGSHHDGLRLNASEVPITSAVSICATRPVEAASVPQRSDDVSGAPLGNAGKTVSTSFAGPAGSTRHLGWRDAMQQTGLTVPGTRLVVVSMISEPVKLCVSNMLRGARRAGILDR